MNRRQAAHRNGALSNGPVTEEGKAKSSRNALKHGLAGRKMFVLQNEHPQAWDELLDDCVQTWRPATSMEHRIVEEIAGVKWRLRRLYFIETGLFDHEMEQQAEDFAASYSEADEPVRQALAFKSLADNSRSLALLSRYETRLQRAYQQAVDALRQLRSEAAHSPKIDKTNPPNEPDPAFAKTSGAGSASAPALVIPIRSTPEPQTRSTEMMPNEPDAPKRQTLTCDPEAGEPRAD